MPIFQGFGRWGAIGANESYDPEGPLPGELVLLLDMEGADAGTNFTDLSTYGHTVTAFNGATTSTARFKEGSSSALFPEYLGIADHAAFHFEDGPFTVGLWSYHTDTADFLIGQRPFGTGDRWHLVKGTGGIECQISTDTNPGDTPIGLLGGSDLTNQWVHHAISRNASGKFRLRQNGVVVDSEAADTSAVKNVSGDLRIGRGQWTGASSFQMAGNIDLVFIAKGVDLFDTDGDITPPDTVAEILAFFP